MGLFSLPQAQFYDIDETKPGNDERGDRLFFGSRCRSVTLPIRLRLRLTEGISASRWYVIGQHFFYQLVLPLRRQLAQPKHVQLKWLEYLKIFKYGHL
jgi:hypothetical protein